MEQHPVPQHISSYEFRLVGNMTLKQFGLLAGPCIIALIFYALPIASYFKWPAIIFFVFLGVAMAFLPIEERPLDRWIVAFLKAVYSPTQFVWKKQAQKPTVFETEPVKKAAPPRAAPPPDQAQLEQYLQTLPATKTPLEKQEESFLEKVLGLFQVTKMPSLATQPVQPTKPVPPTPPKPVYPETKKVSPPLPPKRVAPPPQPQPQPPTPAKKPLRLKIEPIKRGTAVEAKLSSELPIPQTPQTPNILVGMALDPKGNLIEGAILEIRDSQGIPVRALKTNRLGQFRIATPLKDGVYEIETEKEGYLFDIIKITLKGEIVAPIEIRAKGTAHEA